MSRSVLFSLLGLGVLFGAIHFALTDWYLGRAMGGGVAERGQSYLGPLAARARAEAFSEASAACRIEKARAGYSAGALGAALLTFEGAS